MPDGVLYGSAFQGGAYFAGTAFKLAPPAAGGAAWTETVLHTSMGGGDGVCPAAPPVVTSGGALYGATTGLDVELIGYPGVSGLGTVFELTPPAAPGGSWVKTVLASFGGGERDGPLPDSTPIVREGAIYGTVATRSGGGVFELRRPTAPGGTWTKVILQTFTDGSRPHGWLTMGRSGTIYGVTFNLSQPDVGGTVYEIRP